MIGEVPDVEKLRGRISDHAVVRWIERVWAYNTIPCRKVLKSQCLAHPCDKHLLLIVAAAGGPESEAVRRAMATPALSIAMFSGASALRVGRHRLVIRDGCVVTVKTVWEPRGMIGWPERRTEGRRGEQAARVEMLAA